MSNLDMSLQMQVYNSALAWARRTGLTDDGRVNRALGILKKPGALERAETEYGATVDGCDCPDSQFNGVVCKHRIAVMMQVRVDEGKSEFFGDDD
jgi:hypothetical protein